MIYIICLAMFVILGAWLVSTYTRFHHLYSQVQSSWKQWADATRERNLRVGDFARQFSAGLPRESLLPRDLRRLADDSSRVLKEAAGLPALGSLRGIAESEKRLRQAMASSVNLLENNRVMRDNRHLMQLCSEMSVSLVQQEQFARFYNRHAGLYNSALNSPSGRIFGPMMGFTPVERM